MLPYAIIFLFDHILCTNDDCNIELPCKDEPQGCECVTPPPILGSNIKSSSRQTFLIFKNLTSQTRSVNLETIYYRGEIGDLLVFLKIASI